jgi:hypothetical protein
MNWHWKTWGTPQTGVAKPLPSVIILGKQRQLIVTHLK